MMTRARIAFPKNSPASSMLIFILFFIFLMFLLLLYVLLKFNIDQVNELFLRTAQRERGRGNLSWDKNTTEFRGGKKEVG